MKSTPNKSIICCFFALNLEKISPFRYCFTQAPPVTNTSCRSPQIAPSRSPDRLFYCSPGSLCFRSYPLTLLAGLYKRRDDKILKQFLEIKTPRPGNECLIKVSWHSISKHQVMAKVIFTLNFQSSFHWKCVNAAPEVIIIFRKTDHND